MNRATPYILAAAALIIAVAFFTYFFIVNGNAERNKRTYQLQEDDRTRRQQDLDKASYGMPP